MHGQELAAVKKCAAWLSYCLSIGWAKSDLDFLQALWWKYHDKNGDIVSKGATRP